MVSHGEVIAPDFSDFLLLDKAAACFRSSRFLALKKKNQWAKEVFAGQDVFHADAKGDNVEVRKRWTNSRGRKQRKSSRVWMRGKKSICWKLISVLASPGIHYYKTDALCNTNKPWSALVCWINRIYNLDIWNHIWFIQKWKNTFINSTVFWGKKIGTHPRENNKSHL